MSARSWLVAVGLVVPLYTAVAAAQEGTATSDAGYAKLIARLRDPTAHIRWQAAFLLGEDGPDAAPAAAALVTALTDSNLKVRCEAADALTQIGAAAVPALIDGLRSDDAVVRLHSARALGRLGPEGVDAVPALVAALADSDEFVRAETAEALGAMGEEAKEARPALTNALSDASASVRHTANLALSALAWSAAPEWTLEEMVRSPDEDVRFPAAVRLWRQNGTRDARVILEENTGTHALHVVSHEEWIRRGTVFKGRLFAPNLARSLLHPNPQVRSIAATELALLGPAAKGQVGALAAALQDLETDVRIWAAIALDGLGPDAEPAAAALERASHDPHWMVRQLARRTLERIEQKMPP